MDLHEAATELLLYAGLSESPGRPFSDPVYNAVTEGRQTAALRSKQFYSSCGDLAHWLLYRLGVRAAWVNRAEHQGWVFGVRNNVSLLAGRQCFGLNPVARQPLKRDQFEAGDILIVSALNSARTHVICVIAHEPERDEIFTAEYGQPHGALRTHVITRKSSGLYLGERRIDSVLKLDCALVAARSADMLAEAESATEYAHRFNSRVA